jgi:predicted ATP-dependent endonuclease of OLD family
MAHFERLELNNWRQFEAIDIRFGTQTTVVTGANGCGKTSILTVLGHHFGWNLPIRVYAIRITENAKASV